MWVDTKQDLRIVYFNHELHLDFLCGPFMLTIKFYSQFAHKSKCYPERRECPSRLSPSSIVLHNVGWWQPRQSMHLHGSKLTAYSWGPGVTRPWWPFCVIFQARGQMAGFYYTFSGFRRPFWDFGSWPRVTPPPVTTPEGNEDSETPETPETP